MGIGKVLWVASVWLFTAYASQPDTNKKVPPRSREDVVIESNRRISQPRSAPGKSVLTEPELVRARIFKRSKPSVVHIISPAVEQDPNTKDLYLVPAGSGSGFVWDEAGHVVTNLHVISIVNSNGLVPAPEYRVTLADGKSYKAQVIGFSAAYDVAVLQVFAPLKDLKPLPVGNSTGLMVGQTALALGNPFGLDHTLTMGIVSALDRSLTTQFETTIQGVIQTDAAINPGNSGGPLMDGAGQVIGMNTAIPNATGASIGIGFAIPAEILKRVVPILIENGGLERPHLGFDTLSLPEMAQLFGIKRGVVISAVEPDGPAAKAGLQPIRQRPDGGLELGDVIIGYQDQPVETGPQLFAMLEKAEPRTPLVFDVVRGKERIKVTLHPLPPKVQHKAKATI